MSATLPWHATDAGVGQTSWHCGATRLQTFLSASVITASSAIANSAQRSDYSLLIVDDPSLALDLDTAEDYERLSRQKRDTVQMAS